MPWNNIALGLARDLNPNFLPPSPFKAEEPEWGMRSCLMGTVFEKVLGMVSVIVVQQCDCI